MTSRRSPWVGVLVCGALALAACRKRESGSGRDAAVVLGFDAAGLAPPERDWTAADMRRAAELLTKLDPAALPRHDTPLFARLTSKANLAVFRDESLPIGRRMMEASDYLESTNALYKAYFAASQRRTLGTREVIALMGTMLHGMAVIVPVSDAFMRSLPPDDPKLPVRQQGLAKMRAGFAEVVAGTVLTLGERATYPAAERARLAADLHETLPTLAILLSDDMRRALPTDLADLARAEPEPALRALLEELAQLASTP